MLILCLSLSSSLGAGTWSSWFIRLYFASAWHGVSEELLQARSIVLIAFRAE